jgi:histidine ammonia-lyase
MGATSALKLFEVLDRVERVLAIEWLCAGQALDFLAPLKPGQGPAAAQRVLRSRITFAERDREFHQDMSAAHLLLTESEELLATARG